MNRLPDGWPNSAVIKLPLGSLWGIRISLNPLLVVFVIGWGFLGTLSGALLIFLVVLAHELAHSLAARALGVNVKEVELYPFGGVARIEEQLELEPYVERRLALAGPAVNMALAGGAVILFNRAIGGADLLRFFIELNLTMAFFNLLPALPLDGGRLLRSYISPLCGYRAATEHAARSGQVIAVLLFIAGAAGWQMGRINWSLLPVAIFLFAAATREKRQAIYAFLRSLPAKEYELQKKGCLRGEQLVALEETRLLDIFRLFSPHRYHFVRVISRSRRESREISESSLVRAAIKEGVNIPIKKVLNGVRSSLDT